VPVAPAPANRSSSGDAVRSSNSPPAAAVHGRQGVASNDGAAADGGSAGQAMATAAAAANGGKFANVPEPTWALLCAGQLRMIVRSAATGRGSASCGGGASSNAPGAPCHVRCDGMSFRLERIAMAGNGGGSSRNGDRQPQAAPLQAEEDRSSLPQAAAADTSAAASRSPSTSATSGGFPDLVNSTVLPPGASEAFSAAARGAEAVANRAGSILLSVGGAAKETAGPVRFVTDMFGASVKICARAGKITRKSAEQVSNIALFPFRLTSTGGSSGSG